MRRRDCVWRRTHGQEEEYDVRFRVDTPDGVSDYICMTPSGLEMAERALRHASDIVVASTEATLRITYPIADAHYTQLTSDGPDGFTRLELVRKIGAVYQRIYDEEESTTTLPVESVAERMGGSSLLSNRAETNGIHGIYGHHLADLALHTVFFEPERRLITLAIDS